MTAPAAHYPIDAPAVPSHAQARRALLAGRDPAFAPLRRLESRKRLGEIAAFLCLGAASVLLNLAGLRADLLPARILGTLGAALAINGLILLMHEGMHGLLFTRRALNRWVSAAFGMVFLMSFSAYRVLHTRHHRYLGDPRDPDDYHNYARRPGAIWVMQYLRLTIGPYLYILVMPFLAYRHGSAAERAHILQEYAILLPVYALVFTFLPPADLLWLWFLPLVGAAHLTAVRGLSQHAVARAGDPYLASRSIQAGPMVRFFMLNENYHLEHHLFPEVPSYHLAAAHRLVAARLPRSLTTRSYLGFLARFFAQSARMDETPIGLTGPHNA